MQIIGDLVHFRTGMNHFLGIWLCTEPNLRVTQELQLSRYFARQYGFPLSDGRQSTNAVP